MPDRKAPSVAIVDYGMGNLFSIEQACRHQGLNVSITTSPKEVANASGLILPGVGAFGDAMESLRRMDLIEPLRDYGTTEKPLMAVCLGMQLLMSESSEFGNHTGLGIIDGPVKRFNDETLKVPQVGWNRVFSSSRCEMDDPWSESYLAGLHDGEYMYFVHSFYVEPTDPDVVLATSTYGDLKFCSSLSRRNIFACQFHPERSGIQGLKIYTNLAHALKQDLT